jgi:hypothetical protein
LEEVHPMVDEGCGAKGLVVGLLLLPDKMTMDVCKGGDEEDEASLSDGTLVVADEVRLEILVLQAPLRCGNSLGKQECLLYHRLRKVQGGMALLEDPPCHRLHIVQGEKASKGESPFLLLHIVQEGTTSKEGSPYHLIPTVRGETISREGHP